MAELNRKLSGLKRPTKLMRLRMEEAQRKAQLEVEKLSLPGLSGLVVTRDRQGSPYVRLSLLSGSGSENAIPNLLAGLPVKVQTIRSPVAGRKSVSLK